MYTYGMTAAIQDDLGRLLELRGTLDAAGTLHRRWLGRLRRELQAEAVAASTSMEGVAVTVDEVRRILAGDRPPSVSEADAALVSGYRDAMSFVLRRADDEGFRWDSELFRTIHDFVMGHSHALQAGIYRKKPVYVVRNRDGGQVYEAPDAALVQELVDELSVYAEASSDVPAPIMAAMLHVCLAGIHPFGDGNGRTARIVSSLAMYRGGFRRPEFTSLEEWWGRHLADYYAAFEGLGSVWDDTADATRFVETHVRAQRLQVESLLGKERVERDLWAAVQDIAAERFGAVRLADALYDAFFGRDVTNRYYRELADVSVATATNDLTRLRDAGLIVARGGGRTRSYVGSGALVGQVAEVLGVRDVVDGMAPLDVQRDAVVGALAARRRGGGSA
jgi:Fic family protein